MAMKIVDSQVHIWYPNTPERPWPPATPESKPQRAPLCTRRLNGGDEGSGRRPCNHRSAGLGRGSQR